MLSIERCRLLLGPTCDLSDQNVEALRVQLYGLARVLADEVQRRRKEGGLYKSPFAMARSLLQAEAAVDVTERAAIREFEGGLERDTAERTAIADYTRRETNSS